MENWLKIHIRFKLYNLLTLHFYNKYVFVILGMKFNMLLVVYSIGFISA